MTTGAWLLLAVSAGFAVGDWISCVNGSKELAYVCKPATLVALVGVAVLLDPVHADARIWFAVALVLSLAGDVLLMLPSDPFVAGLGAFLLAHVAYIVGLDLHTVGNWWWAIPVLVVVGFLGARLVRGIVVSGQGELVAPVVLYVVVISAMGASALASGNRLAAIGAVLFMLSDSLIGETRFVRPRSWGPVAVMVTYHLGQAGLVLSLVRS